MANIACSTNLVTKPPPGSLSVTLLCFFSLNFLLFSFYSSIVMQKTDQIFIDKWPPCQFNCKINALDFDQTPDLDMYLPMKVCLIQLRLGQNKDILCTWWTILWLFLSFINQNNKLCIIPTLRVKTWLKETILDKGISW